MTPIGFLHAKKTVKSLLIQARQWVYVRYNGCTNSYLCLCVKIRKSHFLLTESCECTSLRIVSNVSSAEKKKKTIEKGIHIWIHGKI